MKSFLKERGISIYRLASDSGVPYSTLNDLINGKVIIDKCKVGMVKAIADTLGLTLDQIYSMLSNEAVEVENSYGITARVSVRRKSYFVQFQYMDEKYDIEMCKVNEDTSYYIEELAKWRSESVIRKERMKRF